MLLRFFVFDATACWSVANKDLYKIIKRWLDGDVRRYSPRIIFEKLRIIDTRGLFYERKSNAIGLVFASEIDVQIQIWQALEVVSLLY